MTGKRRIGPVDTIWLNMDRPDNLMVIDSLLFFDEPVDWERLLAVLRNRLVRRFPVFGQRPVPPRSLAGLPHWEDDPAFSLERHVRRVRLADPGDDARLRRYLERQLSRPLDRDRPLWEMHFVDGYRDGAVLFARFHHALADGIALAGVLLSLTDAAADDDLAEVSEIDADLLPRRDDTRGDTSGVMVCAAQAAASAAVAGSRRVVGAARSLASLPRLARPADVGEVLVQLQRTAAIVRKLLFAHNPATALGGQPGTRKRAVWSRQFPLAEIKLAGRLTGATVNDVLLGAVAGAISGYLVDRGEPPTDLSTMVPVNVRPPDRPLPRQLGNRFALVIFTFPSGLREPLARLAEAKRRMDVIKHSPEAALTFGLITAIGSSCERLERVLVDFFAGKAIGVTTNVAGPTTARYLAGTRISGLLAWVPSSGRQTVGVCIVTYNQTVRVGFKVDAGTVRRPEKLVQAFDREIARLIRLSRAA